MNIECLLTTVNADNYINGLTLIIYQLLFFQNNSVENRQRGRFAGFSLFISNTSVSTTNDIHSSHLCYKDGPELPPLNFTTTCVEQGRYIIFYNERLEEITYPQYYESVAITELCEVIVKGMGFNISSLFNFNCLHYITLISTFIFSLKRFENGHPNIFKVKLSAVLF